MPREPLSAGRWARTQCDAQMAGVYSAKKTPDHRRVPLILFPPIEIPDDKGLVEWEEDGQPIGVNGRGARMSAQNRRQHSPNRV